MRADSNLKAIDDLEKPHGEILLDTSWELVNGEQSS
jgi:hypothetical protein